MKTCGSCKKEKALSEFHKRTRAKDGRQSVCKECNKSQRKAYYRTAAGEAKNKLSGKRWNHQMRAKVYSYLLTHPCVDCGESDPVVLDFDHVESTTKSYNISEMAGRGFGWEKIQLEIDKCVVRCSNCHRRRTAKQFGWYEWMPGW